MNVLLVFLCGLLLISCGKVTDVSSSIDYYAKNCVVEGTESKREVLEYKPSTNSFKYAAFYYDTNDCDELQLAAGLRFQGSVAGDDTLDLIAKGDIIPLKGTTVTAYNASGGKCGYTSWVLNTVAEFLGGSPNKFSSAACVGTDVFYDELFYRANFQGQEISISDTVITLDTDGSSTPGVQVYSRLTDSDESDFKDLVDNLFSY